MREDDDEQVEQDLLDSEPGPVASAGAEAVAPVRTQRIARWLSSNSWLILAAGAALVLTRVVEFSPPEQVRMDEASVDLVGEAPSQEFSSQLGNPQAVQLRATLRLYPRNDLDVREPDPKLDGTARVLSQPVVTTIYAMNATIDQTVRLDGGELEIDVALAGTPRLSDTAGANKVPDLDLEQELTVTSRQNKWLGDPVQRVHLHTRGTLTDLEARPYRWVFVVEGKLFALDLEINRAV
ncbi:hypothetical protein DB30_04109 [Enhygromyxa salina]|uniref:Uncharacterized protein n=1 Tax=Enhygromyxa salina TaxID=215803 RepID=A0A0C2D506_9BACT|nr:hypothetical protein [Enhygromyxa salina]KIG16765.1 hypothetical protein DB30_04109 [Enhygromyxa salina]